MKELWAILMSKLKDVESNYAALGIGIMGLFVLLTISKIVVSFFNMIVEIVTSLNAVG